MPRSRQYTHLLILPENITVCTRDSTSCKTAGLSRRFEQRELHKLCATVMEVSKVKIALR